MNDKKHTTDWDNVYAHSVESGGWPYLSKVIVRTLADEIEDMNRMKIIEAGSGSGRNSLKLAKKGAEVTLLDNSLNTLKRTKVYYSQQSVTANFIQGDIFHMPLSDNSFDLVWNSGVIEHWSGEEQVNCLKEMIRVCKENGLVVTLSPYAGSVVHRLGKWLLLKLGKYSYVDEINIQSLEYPATKAGGSLVQDEYSIGFIVLFVGLFLQLRLLPFGKIFMIPFRILNSFFAYLDSTYIGSYLYQFDKYLSKLFGGYLLVSVIRKS